MKQRWLAIVVVLLLVVTVGGPLVFRRDVEQVEDVEGAARLVIYSPHNDHIIFEMSEGFNRYLKAQGREAVVFDWRRSGGTSDLRRMVLDQFEAAARGGKIDKGIGADLFFGGGEYEHNKLAKGIRVERDGETVWQPVSVAVEVDARYFEEVFPQPRIGGEMLYHPDKLWVGVALSSFGIVYNRDMVGELGMGQPEMWNDLATSEAYGWVALADPAHSGSIGATYNAILMRKGWTEGWSTLRRCFANARYFAMQAGRVPLDVSSGEAAAGMCIDFYGRYQAGSVEDGRVLYVDPKFMTAITADPISVLRGAPNRELANEFAVWLLSKESQGLWQRRVGVEGGPLDTELRRLPIRRDMYVADEMNNWVDDVNPWGIAKPFAKAMPNMFVAVAPISHAMAIDVHDDLKAAWRVVKECDTSSEQCQAMWELFEAMPEELTIRWLDDELAEKWIEIIEDETHPRYDEVKDVHQAMMNSLYARWSEPGQQLRDRMRWTAYFRGNYKRIVEISRSEK